MSAATCLSQAYKFKYVNDMPYIAIEIQGVKELFLIDTGASHSVISNNFNDTFKFPMAYQTQFKITGINGESESRLKSYKVPIFGTCYNFFAEDISSLQRAIKSSYFVSIFGIIGSDFLRSHKCSINYESNLLTINQNGGD